MTSPTVVDDGGHGDGMIVDRRARSNADIASRQATTISSSSSNMDDDDIDDISAVIIPRDAHAVST
jgi:hypothetical protein